MFRGSITHGARRLRGLLACASRARLLAFAALLAAATGAAAQNADLVVNQSDSPDPGPAGGVFTYTVRVDNNGPNAASNVVLTDTLPAGAVFVGATPTQGTCALSAGLLTCNLGNIAFLGTATVSLQVELPTAGVYTNRASATSDTPDPNTTNNVDIGEDTTAQSAADMTLAIVDAPDPVATGQAYAYTVTAVNQGPDALGAADQQTIAFTVPAGACVTALPSGTGWTCTPNTGYPRCSGAISCTRTGALAAGASAPALNVPAVSNTGGTITAAFQVSSTLPDGNPADNTVTAQTTAVGGSSDVSLTKTAGQATYAVGANATFTLTPRFNGGDAPGTLAPNLITVTDTLPAGLAYVSYSGSGWTCAASGQVVTCTRPGPWNGGPFSNMPAITLTATVTGTGTFTNTATISIPESDPVPGNNTASVNISGSNSADLSTTKAASLSPVVPNQPFNYTVSVRNLGPVGVTAGSTISVSDTLDPAIELTGTPTGTGWTCTPNSGFPLAGATVSCARTAALAANTNAPVITIPVRATTAAPVNNTACATLSGSGPADSNPANDCGSVSVASTGTQADLRVVSKVASPDPVNAGEDLTYVITVANDGPDAATNVIVADTLTSLATPGGFRSAVPSQGTCTPSGVTNGASVSLSCNLGTLNAGSTASVTVVVRPSIVVTGSRSNTASVTSSDVGDPDRTNNTGTVTSAVTAVADMQLSKTATPSPVRAGTPLTFVLTPRNNGPSRALNVAVTDPLPPNVAFTSATAAGGASCTTPAVDAVGGTVTCTWPQIDSGTQQTVTIVVRPLTSAAGGTVTNAASVSSSTQDSNAANNAASTSTPVNAALLDVLVNKVDSVDPVALGQSTTYTVTVTNGGPSFGTNVVMVDNFPTGTPTASFSYQGNLTIGPPGIGSCSEPALGVVSGTLTCTFPGLASGASAVVTYDMRAESIAAGISGTTFNTATVSVTEPETLSANNSSTNATTSRRTADLAVTKSAPATATPGTTFDYTLRVTNHGPNDSVGATLTDALPASLVFVAATGGCAAVGGTVTCPLGTLPNGATATFTITMRVPSPYAGPGSVANTASAATVNEVDPVGGNDSSTASTAIGAPSADVSVVKSGPATVGPGGALVYTLTLANAGPSAADGATLTDTLPPGLTGVTASCGAAQAGAACGTLSASNTSVSGTVGTLPVGGSVVITVNAVAPSAGPLVNQASVAAPPGTSDPNPANDSSSVSTAVTPVDFAVVKTHAGTLRAGETGVIYTLTVSNAGTVASNGTVTLADALPAGLVARGIAGPGWACDFASLSCSRSDALAPGASYPPVDVTVDVASSATGSLVNRATVTAAGDVNVANDSADDPATVQPPAAVIPVPALGAGGMALLVALIALAAAAGQRRRAGRG